MKTITMMLLGAALGALAATEAGAQTAAYDTSILKSGNTWVYGRGENTPDGFGGQNDYSGTVTFRIDSLLVAGDTVKFTVTRDDTGTTRLASVPVGTPLSTFSRTIQSTAYTFRNQEFLPSVPQFMVEQTFGDSSRKVVYQADTLRQKSHSSGTCATTSWENIEHIGRIRYAYSYFCGNTHGSTGYSLQSFNGASYIAANVIPVALRNSVVRLQPRHKARISLHQGRVVYGREGKTFDLKGQNVPGLSPNSSTLDERKDSQ